MRGKLRRRWRNHDRPISDAAVQQCHIMALMLGDILSIQPATGINNQVLVDPGDRLVHATHDFLTVERGHIMQNQSDQVGSVAAHPARSQAGCVPQLLDNGQYFLNGRLRDIIFAV
jgi:hypothetical protein